MSNPERFTYTQKLEAVEREIKQRKYVYPRRVQDGKMTQRLADYQLAIMEEIAKDYVLLAKGERLI